MVAVELLYVNHFHVYQTWSKLIVIEFMLFYLSLHRLRFCFFSIYIRNLLTFDATAQLNHQSFRFFKLYSL